MSDYKNPRPSATASAADPCVVYDNAVSFDKLINNDEIVTTYKGVAIKSLGNLLNELEDEALSRSRVSSPVVLTDDQELVSFSGFNASLSAYYVVSPLSSDSPSYRLFKDVHYTVADESTEEIELSVSFPAGYSIVATSLDPTGTGILAVGSQYLTSADLAAASGIQNGYTVTVIGLANAVYKVSASGTTVNAGDIAMTSGQVAVLQPSADDKWDVRWFGAESGVSAQDTYFENAAARALIYAKTGTSSATKGGVIVPTGNWYLTEKNATPAVWYLSAGAEFQTPTNYSGNNVDNVSYLNGSIVKVSARGDNLVTVGATDLSWLQDVRDSILGTAVHTAISPNGKVGYLAASRTSDKTVSSEGTIPFKAYVLNDNETTKGVAYGMYKEAIRWPDAGTTFCEETNVTTYGVMKTVYPNQTIGNSYGATVNYWIGGPVGSGPLDDDYDKERTSAAMVTTGGSAFDEFGDRLGFDTILVVLHDSMNTSPEREVFRLPTDTKQAYYSETGVRRVYTNARDNSSNGEYDVVVRSVGGIDTTYTFASAYFAAGTNSEKNLGRVGGRWLGAYLENAPDVVSDINKKTSKRSLSTNEINAGLELARNVQMFKWISEVAEKGEDDAYYHTSVMAQEAWQILIDNGLEPTEYGFISNQSDNWSIMPTELSMLMSAALVSKQDELETRLAALEAL